MITLRRGLLALSLAGIAAVAVRLRAPSEVPVQTGGWRELTGPDLH